MRRFVAVDLETTGVDPHTDFIVEVGMAGEDYITGRYFEMSFALDFPHERMSEGAAKVNGWGKRQFGPTVDYGWASGYLTSQLNDVHIVGKNPWFDVGFLRHFLRVRGGYGPGPMPWYHRLVDVGCLAWGRASSSHQFDHPPDVEDCEWITGIQRETVDGFHTALLDARWAYEAFRTIVPLVEEV
jgi:hypothetical protein